MLGKIYKLSDKHGHDLKCELMTVYLYQRIKMDMDDCHNKLLAHVLSTLAAKMTMDGDGHRSINRLYITYGEAVKTFEHDMIQYFHYSFPHHPWMVQLNQQFYNLTISKHQPGSSFKYLFRYAALNHVNCNLITLLLSFKLLKNHNIVIHNIIKFSKVYKLFYQMTKENDTITMTDLITMYNRVCTK